MDILRGALYAILFCLLLALASCGPKDPPSPAIIPRAPPCMQLYRENGP